MYSNYLFFLTDLSSISLFMSFIDEISNKDINEKKERI